MDMDTPEELAGIRGFAMHREIPSPEECEAILTAYQPDERVARHSRVVSQVAHRLAVALAERGVSMEPLLVRAAGLLHDVAKGKSEHAEAGGQLLRDLEFATVAEVVEVHTDYPYTAPKLDEAAIVYLADKLVSGDRVVGLEQRFQRSFERFHVNPAALASTLRRRTTAKAIVHEIESRLGVDLQQAIGDLPEMNNGLGE
jgi:HD superfamily phosphodiesterase